MIALNPSEQFPIVRGLTDHTDSATYYVRAVIRNAKTDAILATVNLADQGDGRRFLYTWQVVADSSGQGLWISITTSVYTDSGYTTKGTYRDEFETYLVQDRVNPFLLGGGGGGADVNYEKIKKIVQEVIKGIPVPKEVKVPKTDLSAVLEAIGGLREAVSAITIPIPSPVDLSVVLSKIDQAIAAASDKSVGGEQTQLLSDLHDKLAAFVQENSNESQRKELDEALTKVNTALENIQEFFTADVEEIKAGIESIKNSELVLNVPIKHVGKESE